MKMCLYVLKCTWPRVHDEGPPLPFSPSRIQWLKAINKVRVQLREVSRASHWSFTPRVHSQFTPAVLVEFHLFGCLNRCTKMHKNDIKAVVNLYVFFTGVQEIINKLVYPILCLFFIDLNDYFTNAHLCCDANNIN